MKPLYVLEKRIEKVVEAVNLLVKGRSNAAGSVTLTTSSATSTVTNPVVGKDAKVQLTPADANAASEVASTYVSSVADGSFVITHPNNGDTRVWYWHAVGG